jgi:hypothetical protein
LPHVSGYKDNASGRDKKIHPRKKGLQPEKTHFLPTWQQLTHAHEKNDPPGKTIYNRPFSFQEPPFFTSAPRYQQETD